MSTSQSKYAAKKERMKNGTYHGTSPFYQNIPEYQHLLPLSAYGLPNRERNQVIIQPQAAVQQS